MKKHNWTKEEIDGGSLGLDDFWKCVECGASGGPVMDEFAPTWEPFLADGSGLKVGYDCDAAKNLIASKGNV